MISERGKEWGSDAVSPKQEEGVALLEMTVWREVGTLGSGSKFSPGVCTGRQVRKVPWLWGRWALGGPEAPAHLSGSSAQLWWTVVKGEPG